MAETITVILSDLHAGSSTAVCTPQYTEHTGRGDEEKVSQANKLQEWLYACWVDYNDYIKTLIGLRGKHRKRRLVTLFLGEFVDGNHHGTVQALPEVNDQAKIAIDLMQPLVDLSDGGLFVTPGTEAHSGPAGANDFGIADKLGAVLCDWQLTLDIDGTLVDMAHHDKASYSDWISAASRIAATVMLDCAKDGRPLPRYIFRGHSHVIDDSGERIENTRAICLPSWQLRTAFGYKVSSRKRRSDIGGMIMLPGGVLDFTRARYRAPGEMSHGRIYHV